MTPDSDLLSLWLTLVILYLLEGFVFVPCGSIAFVWTRKDVLRPRFAPTWLRNDRGGIVFGTPWPWNMGVVIADGLRLGVGTAGVYRYRLEELDPHRPAPWEVDNTVVTLPEALGIDGRTVTLDGRPFVGCGSPAHAEWWRTQAVHWLKTPPEQRAHSFPVWMEQITDADKLRERLAQVARATLLMRILGSATTVVALAGLPLADFTVGLVEAWPWLLSAIYGIGWIGTGSFYIAHRKLWPTKKAERWTQVVLQLLVPIVTMRASELFARTALVGVHPLGIAVLNDPKAHRPPNQPRFIHHVVRDLLATRGVDTVINDTTSDPFYQAWKTRVFDLVGTDGMDLSTRQPFPEAESPTMTRYCPRCDAQFPATATLCSDCAGIVLVSMEANRLFSTPPPTQKEG
ncbi:MAG: hypothetical protein HUU55_02535 [Myxococcales bacterium]|nr:hypothetical protein [Myxococcales bacterium]